MRKIDKPRLLRSIKKVTPFFWKECRMCNYKYKKEDMWRYNDIYNDKNYICCRCILSKEDLITYFSYVYEPVRTYLEVSDVNS